MPEYLAPGVYLEEVSYRAKSIEGVATSTTGFVGQTRFGPVGGIPMLVTSFEEYRRFFGGLQDINFSGIPTTNYMAHAVKAYYENGGKRLYMARVFLHSGDTEDVAGDPTWVDYATSKAADSMDVKLASETDPVAAWFRARFPGLAGNLRLQVHAMRSRNLITVRGGKAQLNGVRPGDIIELRSDGAELTERIELASELTETQLHWAELDDEGKATLHRPGASAAVPLTTSDPGTGVLVADQQAYRVTLAVRVGSGERVEEYRDLSTHPASAGAIQNIMRQDKPYDEALRVMLFLEDDFNENHCINLFMAILGKTDIRLDGGSDGLEASDTEVTGTGSDETATGLKALAEIDDIAIVAAPGCAGTTAGTGDPGSSAAAIVQQAIRNALVTHCENLRYRFAILSAGGPNLTVNGIRAVRSQHDSKYAAMYYPWVTIRDPFGKASDLLHIPPEGFVAGICARSDIERGVHKAPANEIVRGAIGFSRRINKATQDVLNPEGINCFRFFEGRGYRLWGARTISSDPEWTYLNVRRLFIYMEHSIDRSTQWAVFEPNNEELWLKIRLTIASFLVDVWRTGALLGLRPEDAFFVKCDRTTMTQGDLDNGRLICLIGVAPTKPAEYVIFRIGQWTADASLQLTA